MRVREVGCGVSGTVHLRPGFSCLVGAFDQPGFSDEDHPGVRAGRLVRVSEQSNAYAQAGVDTAAGDLAVELMKSAVARTHGPEVLGGVGGFAGLVDGPLDAPGAKEKALDLLHATGFLDTAVSGGDPEGAVAAVRRYLAEHRQVQE